MKYGEHFEKESVPGWSLHNIDYNSLKHHIKVHTTKDQATAITIPGHQDSALSKFEDELFLELCRQHDRVDLFVSTKASELSRRLEHLSNQIHRLLVRCATYRDRFTVKQQRRFVRYEQELVKCGDDIHALSRFVNAQVIAFRKILKKYRKWTGSAALGSRFRDTVLSHPKSFTKRDFCQLQSQYEDLLGTLRASTPTDLSGAATPADNVNSRSPTLNRNDVATSSTADPGQSQLESQELPAPALQQGYWNEYDCGSEAGDFDNNGDGEYAIYIDPSEEHGFPGMATLIAILRKPLEKTKAWFALRHPRSSGTTASAADAEANEHAPLIHAGDTVAYGSTSAPLSAAPSHGSYFTNPPGGGPGTSPSFQMTDTEDDQPAMNGTARRRPRRSSCASSEGGSFPPGYSAHYAALPSVNEQRVARYRERVLFWGTLGAFGGAFVFLTIAAVLIATGRHRLRFEVDAGVTIGVCASLSCACAGLGMNMNVKKNPRHNNGNGSARWITWLAIWGAFVTLCVLNGILLVRVVGNSLDT